MLTPRDIPDVILALFLKRILDKYEEKVKQTTGPRDEITINALEFVMFSTAAGRLFDVLTEQELKEKQNKELHLN